MPSHLRGRTRLAAATATLACGAITLTTPAAPADVVIVSPRTAAPVVTVTTEGSTAAGAVVSSRTSGSYGYFTGVSNLLGETPAGLQVWVKGSTPHHANLASNAKATVALWRKLGLKAAYRGYGSPRPREGVVTVTEGLAGCTGGHAGMTWNTWMPLSRGRVYMRSARVVICPSLYRYARWQWSATIRHELGHAAGLGHFDGTYRGSTQVMRSVNHAPVASFKAGDVNGLKYLASNNTRVRNAIPPHGRLESALLDLSTLTGGLRQMRLTGWAMLDWYRDKPVDIVVIDNGRRVTTVRTTIYRPGINRRYDPGTRHRHGFSVLLPSAGTHKVCLTAVSPVDGSARARLGCAYWG
jgi:hypothetical protein